MTDIVREIWKEYMDTDSQAKRIELLKKYQIFYSFRDYPGFYTLLDSYLQDLIKTCKGEGDEESSSISES